MTLEAFLASLHMVAILTLVVFLSSEAALCRSEWMNEAVVRRLAKLDLIYGITALVLLLTGIARIVWGAKGVTWYVSQPLFHLKVLLFVVAAVLSLRPTFTIRKWLKALNVAGSLPQPESVRFVRKWIMVQAHIIPVIAVIAVYWARGM
jgi:putative membrane protein